MVIMAHLAQMKSTLKSILESTDYDVTDAVSILLPKSPKNGTELASSSRIALKFSGSSNS